MVLALPQPGNATFILPSEATQVATETHDPPIIVYAGSQPSEELGDGQSRAFRDASTSAPPLRAPLGAAIVGHPLAPNAMEQRQRIIDVLVTAIKVTLVLLAVSICCLLYMSKEVDKMKEAIRHRIWKRR